MELLLINHPLDCPVCDKGGECPLQNQAMSNGRATSRFEDIKRTYPKPINISSQVLLDRERCVLCARCTRFSDQVAGDPFINLVERGALQQVGIYEEHPFESYFSGNTVQICPVGALTGAAYRFRSRPFDLVSTPSACEHCASGCSLRTDHRRGTVLRRMAQNDPAVNEEWNCDKGRWAFQYANVGDRLQFPMVRKPGGELSSPRGPRRSTPPLPGCGAKAPAVLVGGRVSAEDAYAYGKFARAVLGTNDVDFRARPHSAEEAAFLASHVVATGPDGGAVTYADLEKARPSSSSGSSPRTRARSSSCGCARPSARTSTAVYAVAPVATRGLAKVGGRLIADAPGTEPEVLGALATGGDSQTLSAGRRRCGRGGGHPRRRAAGHGARRALGRSQAGCETPAPAWRGSRVGPVSAVRSRPAPCRPCCPAAARSPMPPPAPRLPRSGGGLASRGRRPRRRRRSWRLPRRCARRPRRRRGRPARPRRGRCRPRRCEPPSW
jgi:NADH-quinone oxidoreductase subunit G